MLKKKKLKPISIEEPITEAELKNHCIVRLKSKHTSDLVREFRKDKKNDISSYKRFITRLVNHPKQFKYTEATPVVLDADIPEGINPEALELFKGHLKKFSADDLKFSAEFAMPAEDLEKTINNSWTIWQGKKRIIEDAYKFAWNTCDESVLALYLDIFNTEDNCIERVGIIKRDDGQPLQRMQLSQRPFVLYNTQREPASLNLATIETVDQPCYVSLDIDEEDFFNADSKFDFIAQQIACNPDYFKMSKESPLSENIRAVEKNPTKYTLQTHPQKRYVAEIDLSFSYLNDLITHAETKWHGVICKNSIVERKIEEEIREYLSCIYVDILSEDKKTWVRAGEYQKELRHCSECRVI